MLAILVRSADWVTAGYLADQLGVTPRSVRSYVTAINGQEPDAIESGPLGYRATPRAATIALDVMEQHRGTPRERIHTLIRWLMESTEGVDVFEAALALHVQLCGFHLVEADRKVQRIDPVRGGRSLTSPGIWQDVTAPVPDTDPVNEVLATAASQTMTPAEMMRAAKALQAQAEASAG